MNRKQKSGLFLFIAFSIPVMLIAANAEELKNNLGVEAVAMFAIICAVFMAAGVFKMLRSG